MGFKSTVAQSSQHASLTNQAKNANTESNEAKFNRLMSFSIQVPSYSSKF